MTASQIKPGYDLAGEADRWVLKVRAHAGALPAGQGDALVARVAGRLSIQTGATLDELNARHVGIKLLVEKLRAGSAR